jgi:hypothetical protein
VALCVGTGVAAEAVRRGLVAPERVRTIGVVVDGPDRALASMSAQRPEARRQARAALGLPASATVVGSVGRLTYQKAPEDFVAAIRDLGRGVTGVWVGGGELTERVRRQASRPPEARVILAGERADVLDVLPAFDVFASSSRYEGLPTALVEAMICGVPVVATAVNAVPHRSSPRPGGARRERPAGAAGPAGPAGRGHRAPPELASQGGPHGRGGPRPPGRWIQRRRAMRGPARGICRKRTFDSTIANT